MNLVLDVGNVLLQFDPRAYLEQAVEAELREAVLQAVFLSEEWKLLDRGAITQEQACGRFADCRPDLEAELRTVMRDWVTMLRPMDETLRMLPQWKRRHRLFYLSNMPLQAAEYLLRAHSFWELFDGGVFSYETGLLKPERAIYELLLRRYGLRAEDCLFLDDLQPNVDAAIAVGMQARLFTGTPARSGIPDPL